MDIRKLQKIAVNALEDIKGRDIDVINTSKQTSLFERLIIASADSTRQVKALARNVQEKVKEAGGTVYGVEGEEVGEWVLVDLGDIVVHVMQPAVRSHYNLEELWQAAPRRDSKVKAAKPAAEPAAPRSRGRSGTAKAAAVPPASRAKTPAKVAATPRSRAKAPAKAEPAAKPRRRRVGTDSTE